MNKLRHEAEKLREQGYSYNLIHERLGVSVSTMSYWFKDKPFEPNQAVLERIKTGSAKVGIRRHNQRVAEIKQLKKQGIQEIGELSQRDLWLLGLGIYIGEGAKAFEYIRLSNSDPNVIRLGIRWLKETCELTDENLSVRIHLYPDNDIEASMEYWQGVTGLGPKSFRKPSIDLRTNKQASRSRKLPHGTAHVTVLANGDPEKGVRLFRRINGWMTGALNQI